MSFITVFVQKNPLISVIVFSFIITFFLTFLYKKLVDQNRLQEINEKQKQLREQLKQCNDQQKAMEIQKEMIQYSVESLKMSFKPMIISFIPMIIVLGLLDKLYKSLNIKTILTLFNKLELNWFWIYVIFSFIFSLILQKVMKSKPKKQTESKAKDLKTI
ncbi:MAG: EMC3/TMCO1 family protein [Candidatus Pacearchaeota archaeon]